MKKYNIVALLPIKGHSERIKNKNFKLFDGKPLFFWILNNLLSIPEIEKVVINTDVVENFLQYDICNNDKIILRQRLPEICGDFVSMNQIINDDINAIDSKIYLQTHSTNPLIKNTIISNALTKYSEVIEYGYDSLLSVNRYQSRFYYSDGKAINHNPGDLIRTQDLAPIYEENSCLYIFSRDSFMINKNRIGKFPFFYEIPMLQSADIDTPENWQLAEIIKKELINYVI